MHIQLERELTEVVKRALFTAGFIGGPIVEEFEQNFASQNFANACSNSSTMGPPIKPAVYSARLTTSVSSRSSWLCIVKRSRNVIFFLLFSLFTFALL